jgi:hypothetical protein
VEHKDFCRNPNCGKMVNHMSGYCLNHRKEWMKGYKFGLRIRESTGYEHADYVVKELEMTASYPQMRNQAHMLLRASNLIRSLLKEK